MKKITLFFALCPVLFYGKDYEKQKKTQLVTCLFELKNIFTKLIFWSGPLNLETGKKRKTKRNIEYLKNGKCLLEEIKTIFHNF